MVKRFRDWRRWKLCLPLFAIVATYFFYKFFEAGEEFIAVFGHGDLLLLSGLILMELAVEAANMNQESDRGRPDNIDSLIENSRLFGVVLIFFYGGMKLMVEQQSRLNQIPSYRFRAFCLLSLSITFFVVCFSFFAFWRTLGNVVGSED
jgi:hypothetical protein